MKANPKPILVTGSHRSGSTWTGKMLSVTRQVGYIHEPFNVDIGIGASPQPPEHWFQYLCKENAEGYNRVFGDLLGFKYPLFRNLAKVRTARHAAKIVRDQSLFLWYQANHCRPLVKDPIAFFSAEWLAEAYNMDVLVLIRHPAAFCSSLKIKGWNFNFHQLLDQPLLMERYLAGYAGQIEDYAHTKKGVIEQATLLWNCIHRTVSMYQQEHPEWLFVKHEELSLNPVQQFKGIYKKLGLEFTGKVENKIRESSGGHNSVESSGKNEILRNSRANIRNWENRLDRSEIALVRSRTDEVCNLFYPEDAW